MSYLHQMGWFPDQCWLPVRSSLRKEQTWESSFLSCWVHKVEYSFKLQLSALLTNCSIQAELFCLNSPQNVSNQCSSAFRQSQWIITLDLTMKTSSPRWWTATEQDCWCPPPFYSFTVAVIRLTLLTASFTLFWSGCADPVLFSGSLSSKWYRHILWAGFYVHQSTGMFSMSQSNQR